MISLQSVQRQLDGSDVESADAILIEHVGMTETGFTTVENKPRRRKGFGES
jgi:hypothetical protein